MRRVLLFLAGFLCATPLRAADANATGTVAGDLKVPTRAKVDEGEGLDGRRVTDLCCFVVGEREKKTDEEFVKLKQKMLERLQKEDEERKEKERRQHLYDKHWGSGNEEKDKKKKKDEPVPPPPPPTPAKPVTLKMAFVVPEIQVYERAARACREREALAKDVVATLPRLDLDNDGLLKDDEYLKTAALHLKVERLLEPLDLDKDGFLTLNEIAEAQVLPANVEEAIRKGSIAAKGYRIRTFDANGDGELDVTERKALSMAYASASLVYAKDAAFYDQMAAGLLARRQLVAQKFENLEVKP